MLTACALGFTPYRDGLAIQEGLVGARAEGATGDWLLFPDHPPVLTVGRGGREESLVADPATLARLGVERFEVSRGGDVTWHGPGQLVAYPIVQLDRCGRDLHRYLRGLERALVRALAAFGIEGEAVAGRTGVWVQGAKIASIGIAVRRWVAYHGVALNVAPDLRFFDLIHPCGLRGIHMASLASLLGPSAPPLAVVREGFARELADEFGYSGLCWAGPDEARCAAAKSAGEPAEDQGRFEARPPAPHPRMADHAAHTAGPTR